MNLFEDHNDNDEVDELWTRLRETDVRKRKICNDLYRKCCAYLDSGFPKKFRTRGEFYSRFWEMDLACTLLDCEKKLSKECSGGAGPDFCISRDQERPIWIEATCPDKGEPGNPNTVPEPDNGKTFRIQSDNILLRLTSAIIEKYGNQYAKALKMQICADQDPYVIAINGCRLTPGPGLDDPTPRIVKAVFEGGSDKIQVDRKSGEISDMYVEARPHITKANGEPISLGYFSQDEYSSISALIYSDTSIHTRPTEHGSDYIVVHNPKAKNPLPEGFFRIGTEYVSRASCNGISLRKIVHRCSEYLYE